MRPGTWRLPLIGGARSILILHFPLPFVTCTHYAFAGAGTAALPVCTHYSPSGALSAGGLHVLNALAEFSAQQPFPPSSEPLVSCLLGQVLELLQKDTEPLSKAEMTFRALCTYLQERFREPLTRESAAAHLQIHPAHVSRLFRTVGHTSFHEYLHGLRLGCAKTLLEDPSLGMKEIAAASGFQSADYFREAFRRTMGMPPQAYRGETLRTGGAGKFGPGA